MRARPRMFAAASIASLVIGTPAGVTAPEAQAVGPSLVPQAKAATISPMSSTELSWNEAKGNRVVDIARRYALYIRGSNGPYAFDCSNYTRHVYAQVGVHLSPKPGYPGHIRSPHSSITKQSREISSGGLDTWAFTPGTATTLPHGTPLCGIQEGPVYGNPIYIRVIPSGLGFGAKERADHPACSCF